jgi:hypothetical protein
MRYQLRYIRAPRARCRHVRTETIVHPGMATQISPRLSNQPTAHHILAENAARASLRPRSPASAWLGAGSRGSVGERPLHTRKVAGSIPAGTTRRITRSQGYLPLGTRGRSAHSPRVIRRLSSVTVSRRARRAHPSHDEVGVVEVCVGVCGHHDRRVAHRHLQRFHVGTRRSSQRPVDMPEVVHTHGRMLGCPSSAILVRRPPPVSSFDSEPRALRERDGGQRQHGRACGSSTTASPNEARVDHFEARSSAGEPAASSSGSSKSGPKRNADLAAAKPGPR